MITLKNNYRDNSLAQRIYSTYKSTLGDNLVGVIMCGSAGVPRAQNYAGSDIDYLIVVVSVNASSLLHISESLQKLNSTLDNKGSHTVITHRELLSIRQYYKTMDGKAVQAIIEAQECDLAGLMPHMIPKLSPDEIRDFSATNLPVLQALLRKIIVRSDPNICRSDKVLMAKIALIIQKMLNQQVTGDIGLLASTHDREELQSIKLHPERYNYSTIREIMVQFIDNRNPLPS